MNSVEFMLSHRVIPILLFKEGGLYKTTRFRAPQYVGDPINVVRIFNEKEVDELIILDISASKERKSPNFKAVEQCASECFMPLCYGGGVTSIEDAQQLFAMGVEKVCLQTAALENLSIVSQIAEKYGNQSVVVSVDIKKNWFGKKMLYSAADRKLVNQPWQAYLEQIEAAGAGEVLLNAVDRDGTMTGMDLELIQEAAYHLSIPLIAAGGVRNLLDMKNAIDSGANAVGAGAFFVFHGPHRAVLITYPAYHDLKSIMG